MPSYNLKKIAWLEDLSELLNTHEREVVKEIFCQAESEVKCVTSDPRINTAEIQQKIQIVEENLQDIIRHFKSYQDARRNFVRKYPEWRNARMKSIDALQTIGTSLHEDRKNCNISRLVGNCTSLVGGGIFLVSVALIPFTLGLSTPIAVAGGITSALGSATSVGTSITEIALFKKKVEEAQDIVVKDKESFEAIMVWLTHANDITEALNAVLSIDSDKTLNEIKNTMSNFMTSAVQLTKGLQRITVIKTLIKFTKEILSQEFGFVMIIPSLVALLAVVALLDNKHPQIFQEFYNTMTIVTTTLSVVDTTATFVRQFIKTDAAILQNVGKNVGQISATALAKGAVAVVGISLDVASIVLTSIDVHKGSLSEEGKTIIDAAEKMKEEADMLEKVYLELTWPREYKKHS